MSEYSNLSSDYELTPEEFKRRWHEFEVSEETLTELRKIGH